MCFYDAIEMACKCWKWGQFRKHCAKEYRIGETCGMKLVMSRHSLPIKCKICTKIDGKERAIRKEEERIRRWQAENNGVNSFVQDAWRGYEFKQSMKSIESLEQQVDPDNNLVKEVWDEVEKLKGEIQPLLEDRMRERSKIERAEGGDSGSRAPTSHSTTLETPWKSFTLDSPIEMSSSSASGSPSGKGKEVEPARKSSPSTRFFPINTLKDATLIFAWQEVIPVIKPLLCEGEDTSVSVTLLRQGKTAEDSEPVARIRQVNSGQKIGKEILLGLSSKQFTPRQVLASSLLWAH